MRAIKAETRVAELEAELAAIKETNRWIPVGEQLPRPWAKVVYSSDCWVSFGTTFHTGYTWEAETERGMKVSHWKYLELPEVK